MKVVHEYPPDSERELRLKTQLAELRRRYDLEAKPIIDALAREHSIKAPRILFVQDDALPPDAFCFRAPAPTGGE